MEHARVDKEEIGTAAEHTLSSTSSTRRVTSREGGGDFSFFLTPSLRVSARVCVVRVETAANAKKEGRTKVAFLFTLSIEKVEKRGDSEEKRREREQIINGRGNYVRHVRSLF